VEAQLSAVAEAVRGLEARVAALEAAAGTPPLAAASEAACQAPPGPDQPAAATVLGLLGRSSLVLAGAFLIRTFTGSGALPARAGVALGLAYGLAWILAADRAAAAGRRLNAAFHALTALGIVYPLVLEATLRFAALSPAAAAAILLAATAALFVTALRRGLRGVGWTVAVTALGTGFALMAAASAITVFCALFLVLAGASLWLADRADWRGLRWPAALTADAAVLAMTTLAVSPGGSPELARDLAVPRVLVLALALVVIYLGSFIARALVRPRSVQGFEFVQTLAVLAVGFGGALRVAHAAGTGLAPLGLAALALGLGCYGAAFTFVRRQAEGSADFRFLSTLALVLVLAGSPGLLPAGWLALHFALLGLLGALLGRRFQRRSLLAHSAVLLTAGAFASGFLAGLWRAFVTPGARPGTLFPAPALALLAAMAAGHLLLALHRPAEPAGAAGLWGRRLPGLVLGALGLLGCAALLVLFLAPGGPAGPPAPAALAAARTAALALATVAAAALGRWLPAGGMGWLVHPLLGATGLKLLLEDVPQGHPLSLALAFACFGAALILAPRLARRAPESAAH
jgi:hypothetical protein